MRAVISLALACVACGGVLDEDEASSNPLLDQVTPPTCAEPTTGGDGHHRAGEDCLGCHRQGGDGTPFTIAGTLYTDTGGTAPAVGVPVHVIDAGGAYSAIIRARIANFWGMYPLAAPAVAFSARCPDVIPMQAALTTDDASCNRGGCHTAGFRAHP